VWDLEKNIIRKTGGKPGPCYRTHENYHPYDALTILHAKNKKTKKQEGVGPKKNLIRKTGGKPCPC